jgi:hypothetical protein
MCDLALYGHTIERACGPLSGGSGVASHHNSSQTNQDEFAGADIFISTL